MAGSNRFDYLKVNLPSNCKNFHNSHFWEEAFRMYNDAHPQARVRVGCGSCCQRVLNWINSL